MIKGLDTGSLFTSSKNDAAVFSSDFQNLSLGEPDTTPVPPPVGLEVVEYVVEVSPIMTYPDISDFAPPVHSPTE